jgi:hypothetical protein
MTLSPHLLAALADSQSLAGGSVVLADGSHRQR